MGRCVRSGLVGLAILAVFLGTPAAAGELQTSIDLDYSFDQQHEGLIITETNKFSQRYELKYLSLLTAEFDLQTSLRLELENNWATRKADSSRLAPSLEIVASGSQAAFRFSYQSAESTTSAFQETGDVSTYSNDVTTEFQMTPSYWPQVKLSYGRKRDYQLLTTDKTTQNLQFQMQKDLFGVRVELSAKQDIQEQSVPETTSSNSKDWSSQATYKEVLYGGTEFELAYEIKESYSESYKRGVFQSFTEDYTQSFKMRFKNTLSLLPRLSAGLSWDYEFAQDLLQLDKDYKISNQYALSLRYDVLSWILMSGDLRRKSDLTVNLAGEDNEQTLSDSASANLNIQPLRWLSINSKAEFRDDHSVSANSGASVKQVQSEKYETAIKNKFGDFWDLTVNSSNAFEYNEGWTTKKEGRFKADLRLQLLTNLGIQSSGEVSRTTNWEVRAVDFNTQSQTAEAKIGFNYRYQLLDLIAVTFSHEYGQKRADSLDEVRNFERTAELNEDTRVSLSISNLVRDLKIEGEWDRKGSDTQDDSEPMLVDVSYALKLDWKIEAVSLSTSIKYNDKGDTYNDLTFNASLNLKLDKVSVSSTYQFDKIYSDETDESRKLNLKMSLKF